eukprot:TRINITY_DN1178_c0_g1_i4.p1 TRINITY_DN1178_c0_g1~~TRINITY_DN1178_c0_g1_i4.p1  ORF type:complete len:110 (+),score=20.80 TRINITY_DN1178_c0_g1_i4:342-671(+)
MPNINNQVPPMPQILLGNPIPGQMMQYFVPNSGYPMMPPSQPMFNPYYPVPQMPGMPGMSGMPSMVPPTGIIPSPDLESVNRMQPMYASMNNHPPNVIPDNSHNPTTSQ